jgi:indole-3-glycerol phosphate synthase
MATILEKIVSTKRQEVARAKHKITETELEDRLKDLPVCRGFASALAAGNQVRIIAEIKKASPSAGIIRNDFDPVTIAKIYQHHGAACLSVLTDEEYFLGHLDYLLAVRRVVDLPLLRKDFVIDRYQILEARCAGADAILLIAEILPGKQLADLHDEAQALGLDVLVEFHAAEQLSRVLDIRPHMIGINNRDLHTFVTRLDHTLELISRIPRNILVVSESGIKTKSDVDRLHAHGVKAILVGESLMRRPDIGSALDELRGC